MANPMNYRSTNAAGRFVHFGGALVVGAEYYNGVEINPSSTNTAAKIEAAGDDTNVGLTIEGKGTGQITIGNSSNTVALLGTVQLGSTAAASLGFKGAFTAASTISWAGVTGGHGVEVTLASTTVDVMTGDLVSVAFRVATADLSSNVGLASWRLSTVNASRFTAVLNTFGSTAGSTGSGTLQITWVDLT